MLDADKVLELAVKQPEKLAEALSAHPRYILIKEGTGFSHNYDSLVRAVNILAEEGWRIAAASHSKFGGYVWMEKPEAG